MRVIGTVDCQERDTVFNAYVDSGKTYVGPIPGYANDLLMHFSWDWICGNQDRIKLGVPMYVNGKWKLFNIGSWIHGWVGREGLQLPTVGDSTGDIQEVHCFVNLEEWLSDPREPQEQYNIVNGECADLPGYLLGTEPIDFDSLAGPDENPFVTNPLTGTVYGDGLMSVIPIVSCCVNRGNSDGTVGLGGAVDVADLTYLVAYLFQSGPVPPCEPEGNVDGITGLGGPIDVADLTYLVAFLFQGGPPPPPCP